MASYLIACARCGGMARTLEPTEPPVFCEPCAALNAADVKDVATDKATAKAKRVRKAKAKVKAAEKVEAEAAEEASVVVEEPSTGTYQWPESSGTR